MPKKLPCTPEHLAGLGITLGLFFLLFFTLNYPEIQHQRTYRESVCAVTSVKLEEQYNCYKVCYYVGQAL